MFSSRKKATLKPIPQSNSFAADTFLLRRASESARYKVAALLMFVVGAYAYVDVFCLCLCLL